MLLRIMESWVWGRAGKMPDNSKNKKQINIYTYLFICLFIYLFMFKHTMFIERGIYRYRYIYIHVYQLLYVVGHVLFIYVSVSSKFMLISHPIKNKLDKHLNTYRSKPSIQAP